MKKSLILFVFTVLCSYRAQSQCEIAQQQVVIDASTTGECWSFTATNNIAQNFTGISGGTLRMLPRNIGSLAILPRVYNGSGFLTFQMRGLGSWQVGVMTNPSDGNTFTTISSGIVNSSIANTYNFDYSIYQGTAQYVAILVTQGPYANADVFITNLDYTSGCPITDFPVFNLNDNLSVELDASGNASISTQDIDNGSLTACGNPLSGLSLDISSFSCTEIGTQNVTLSAEYNGNTIGSTQVAVDVVDNILPTATAQNISVAVDPQTGFGVITPEQVNNGSSDNCSSGSLSLSLSKTAFTCEDTGDNLVSLTIQDDSGNTSEVNATVTVTSEASDQIISSANANICPDGSNGATISTDGSLVGFNYTLRNNDDDQIVDGPIAGTGSALNFNTGNLSETTSFNILAEKQLSSSQTALDFDGSNDFVNLGADNRNIGGFFTIATWVKTTNTDVDFIAAKYNGINGFLLVIDADGKVKIDGRDGTGVYKSSGASTTLVNDNEWHYVAATINIANGAWKIYVDGVLENSASNGAGQTLASNANFNIAAQSSFVFPGKYDQLTVWNVELDAATIFSNMTTCLTGSETGVVGHFDFDDGSGTVLTDESATAINGTLMNMDGSTDWIQEISPSCGDRACDYQLSTVISIGDNTPPIAVAQDISIQIDAITGVADVTTADINNGSSDNCSTNIQLSLSQTQFTCDDIGQNNVVLTVEDESGNQSDAQAVVTITSAINEQGISAAATDFCSAGNATTVSTNGSQQGIYYYLRNSSDNTILDGPIEGTGSGLSFNTGNVDATTTFNVYAESNEPTDNGLDFDGINDYLEAAVPAAFNYHQAFTIEAWVNVTLPLTTAHRPIFSIGSSTVSDVEVYVQANTNKIVVVQDRGEAAFGGYGYSVPPSGEWFHLAVTFDGTDHKVFINGVEQAITDNTFAPTSAPNITAGLTLKMGHIRHTAFGASGGFFAGQLDEFRIWNSVRTVTELTDNMTTCLSGSESGLIANYKFNESSGLFAQESVNGSNAVLTNMDTANDWVDGVGIFCLQDCGFQMTEEVTLTIGDDTDPTAVSQNISVTLDASGSATIQASDLNNGSSDNCSASQNLTFTADNTSFSCSDLGENTVNLTVEDESGNQAVVAVTVTVVDDTDPSVTVQDLTLQLDVAGNALLDPELLDNGSSDNCTQAQNLSFSADVTNFDCTDLGENNITLIVTDGSNNQTSTQATVTIVDEINPTASAQNITIELDENGMANILPSDIENGSSDNCTISGELSFDINISSFDCADLGTQNVELTVTDASNNVSTATAQITIEDNMVPDVQVKDITVSLDNSGNASITAADIDDGSSDNCTSTNNLMLSIDRSSFTIADLGSNSVQLTVEDSNGNSASATANVTITEKTVQTISFAQISDLTYGDNPINLDATASSGLSITYNLISGNATLNGNVLTIIGTGEVVIEASQGGDETFAPAETVERTFTVNKAALNVVADDKEITYGDDIPVFTFSYNGFVLNESEGDLDTAPQASSNVSAASDAGSYSIELSGGASDNYTLNYQNGTLTILKADQLITVEPIGQKFMTDPDFAVLATVDSNLELSYEIVSGPASISGNIISLDGTPGTVVLAVSQAGDQNFNDSSVTVSIDVVDPQSEQTITFNTIASRIYGDQFTLTASASSGLDVTYVLISGPATLSGNEVTITGIGTIEIEAQQAGNASFYPADNITQTFDANKAPLTVEADDKTITFGDVVPALTFAFDGFVNNEDEQVLSELPTISTSATDQSDAGAYDIILDGGAADNYAVSLVNGILTIDKATGLITISDLSQEEDGTAKSPTVTTDPAGLNFNITYDGSSTEPVEDGTYSIVVTIDEVNYQGTATESFVINPVAILSLESTVEVNLYPNPAIDYLNIDLGSFNQALGKVYNLDGLEVMEFRIEGSGGRVDISRLIRGLYLMHIHDSVSNELIANQKIIITK